MHRQYRTRVAIPKLEVSADFRIPRDGFSKGSTTSSTNGTNANSSALPFSTLPYGDSTTMSGSSGNEGSMYDVLNELVFSYLVHHGYADTASKFAQSIERSTVGLLQNGGPSSIPSTPQLSTMTAKHRRGTVKPSSDSAPMMLDTDMSKSEMSSDFDQTSSKDPAKFDDAVESTSAWCQDVDNRGKG